MRALISITLRFAGFAAALLVALPTIASSQVHANGAGAPHEVRFLVITNVANPTTSLDRADASKMFLGKRAKWQNGASVQPVDLVESSPVRKRFSTEVHGMGVPSVKSYWQEAVFSGKGAAAPPERATEAEVIAYVRSNPNAVGYISASSALTAEGVKIISLKP